MYIFTHSAPLSSSLSEKSQHQNSSSEVIFFFCVLCSKIVYYLEFFYIVIYILSKTNLLSLIKNTLSLSDYMCQNESFPSRNILNLLNLLKQVFMYLFLFQFSVCFASFCLFLLFENRKRSPAKGKHIEFSLTSQTLEFRVRSQMDTIPINYIVWIKIERHA